MKKYLIIALLGLIPFLNNAQSTETREGFGFAVNSSFDVEFYNIRIVPSATYFKGNNQLEFGVGFNPSGRTTQKLFSSEFNYKYFPNGYDKKYNMYFISRLSYVNSQIDKFYPTTYNYVFVHGGYGFEVQPFENAYISTNVSLGAFTFNKNAEIPFEGFTSQSFFDEIGMDLDFQFSIGYRF